MIEYKNYPSRLNLGCGNDIRKDYINIDISEKCNPDFVEDASCLGKFPSSYYDEIIANNLLECFEVEKIPSVLNEWCRLLKRGGILRMTVPNVIGLLELFMEQDNQQCEEQYILLKCLYGTQDNCFRTSFTKEIIIDLFQKSQLEICDIADKETWLLEIIAIKRD